MDGIPRTAILGTGANRHKLDCTLADLRSKLGLHWKN